MKKKQFMTCSELPYDRRELKKDDEIFPEQNRYKQVSFFSGLEPLSYHGNTWRRVLSGCNSDS